MAEEAKIKVTVDNGVKIASADFKDLSTKVKDLDYQFRQQKISATQLSTALSDVDARAKSLNLTYKQQVDLNAQIFQVQQRAAVGFKSLSQQMHEQTQASNRSQQSFVALAYIIQDLPYGIRGVANNITQLSQILGTPIWLNLAISAFTSLAVVFDSNKNKVKELSDELKSFEDRHSDFLLKMGINTRAMRESDLEWQVAQAEGNLQRLSTGQFDFRGTVLARAGGKNAKAVYSAIGSPDEIRTAQSALEALIVKLKDFRDETDKLNEKQEKAALKTEKALEKQFLLDLKFRVAHRQFLADTVQYGGVRGYGVNNKYGGQQKIGDVSGVTVPDIEKEGISKDFKFYDNMFFDPMKQGFNDMNSIIRNQLFGTMDELRQRWGLLGASIIQSLQAVIAKLIETAIMTTVLSAVTGGNWGSVFQFLGSGGSGSQVMSALGVGGRSIGSISPKTVNQIATGSSMANRMQIEVIGKIGNDAIYISGERYKSMKLATSI